MAQRLATEYVDTCLVLDEAEWLQLLQLFGHASLAFKVVVLDNGDQELLLQDAAGRVMSLTFERQDGRYVLEGSCRFTDLKLANAMRTAISRYGGDALAHRIYTGYTVVYEYRGGKVVRIAERSARGERLIYEHIGDVPELVRTFMRRHVEERIEAVRAEIDRLLDLRNEAVRPEQVREIDEKLKRQSGLLFALEA